MDTQTHTVTDPSDHRTHALATDGVGKSRRSNSVAQITRAQEAWSSKSSSDARSSQVDGIIAVARRRTSGQIKPEVEVGRRGAAVARVAGSAETRRRGGGGGGVARSRRADEGAVAGEQAVAAALVAGGGAGGRDGGGGGGGEVATLGVGRLAAPLDAPVLKPDLDLRLDETELCGQVAPADRPHTHQYPALHALQLCSVTSASLAAAL